MITRCDIMHLLLDKYNQEQIRNVTVRPHAPRFSDDLRELKRVKRRLERKFQSSRLSIDKQIYNRLLEVSKTNFLK